MDNDSVAAILRRLWILLLEAASAIVSKKYWNPEKLPVVRYINTSISIHADIKDNLTWNN